VGSIGPIKPFVFKPEKSWVNVPSKSADSSLLQNTPMSLPEKNSAARAPPVGSKRKSN